MADEEILAVLERTQAFGPGSTESTEDVLAWRAALRNAERPAAARALSRKLAEEFIAGRRSMQINEIDVLWKACKADEAFSHARRVLMRRRGGNDARILPADQGYKPPSDQYLREQHALITSKDPDLSASLRHEWALTLLNADLKTSSAEALGIAGGIWKRRWEYDGKVSSLECSLEHYLAPVERDRPANTNDEAHDRVGRGVTVEDGYPAVNAAFICDLLARQTRDEANRREYTERANQLRARIVRAVPERKDYWVLVTLAEAKFGLGQVDEAVALLTTARTLQVDPWERDTTARQFARLGATRESKELDITRAVAALVESNESADARIRSLRIGKVGLALSGGGFRASLYHLGVLARLAESDILRHVEALSTVSGGSMIGAAYYLRLKELLATEASPTQQRYCKLVEDLIDDFLKAMAANLRSGLFMNLKTCNAILAGDDDTYSRAMSEAVFDVLYGRTVESDPHMSELSIRPPLEDDEDFHPRYNNPGRAAKVPALLLNAATLNTGHVWQFTTTSMGESPFSIVAGADPLPRLRRANYVDTRGQVVRGVTLSQAVAASACVPGLFAPLTLRGLYPGYEVRLVDGGVYDNQGALALLQEDCNVLIVSDGCGQLGLEKQAGGGRMGPVMRSFGIFQERMRLAGYENLKDARDSGRLAGLACVHLKKDLDAGAIDWEKCEDPSRSGDQFPATALASKFTSYGVWKDYQEHLANIRTDLDVFSDIESAALMADGYMAMDAELKLLLIDVPALGSARKPQSWFFSPLMKRLADPNQPVLERHLKAGSSQFLRLMNIDEAVRRLVWTAVGILVLLALVLIYLTWDFRVQFSVGTLVLLMGAIVATMLVRRLFGEQTWTVFLVDPLGALRRRGSRWLAALGGWMLARWLVPRLTARYTAQGRLERLD